MSQAVQAQSQLSLSVAVLLIDEDLEHLEFLRRTIQAIGYSVQACNSYREGIRQLSSGAFEIIVVGQGSRNFEGRCVLECATEFNRRLPVVVVARRLEMACYLDAMQLGAVDYLAGPLGGAEMARVMRTHTRNRQRPPASAELQGTASSPSSTALGHPFDAPKARKGRNSR